MLLLPRPTHLRHHLPHPARRTYQSSFSAVRSPILRPPTTTRLLTTAPPAKMTHDPVPSPIDPSTHNLGPDPDPVKTAKRKAAYQAVDAHFPANARAIGIGSGSTVVFVVERIRQLPKERTDGVLFVPTGYQSRELIVEAGLRLASVDEDLELDVVFDGADEVDPELNCIKGGGACLFQEKLVAISGKKFVCVADFRKISQSLSTLYKPGVPVEVVPPSATYVLKRLAALGAVSPKLRMGGTAKAGPCITDNGNFIIDAPFPHGPKLPATAHTGPVKEENTKETAAAAANREERADVRGEGEGVQGIGGNVNVEALAKAIKNIVGVVEHGLFWRGDKKPVMAYFGMEDGGVTTQGTAS